MAFKIQITGVDELALHQFVTEVIIERSVYNHSQARITMQWHEDNRYGDRHTATMAAKALNCPVDIQWKDNDLAESVDCFHGYVENVSGQRYASGSRLILDCVSFSKRTDLVPRYRAFQACKLLDICQQIAKTEPLIKIDKSGDLNFDIPLSMQYGETDFAYLSRMLHAWGMPVLLVEKTGEVLLSTRGTESDGKFPEVGFGWERVDFHGSLVAVPKAESGGSGATSAARGQESAFLGQLKDKARDYDAVPETPLIRKRVSAVHSQVDTSHYHLVLDGAVLPYIPGQVVKFDSQDHIIRSARITGHPNESTATQEFTLQSLTLPFQPERTVPQWPSRALWAWVTENENDPEQSGRIQVKFDLEHLDPQSSSEKAWLHTLTPYGGGKSPSDGKAAEYNGLYSLPEVGERVLVEFLGDWDSEAVVIGTVRHKNVNPMYNAKDTKRWRTPSGNEIAMTTKDGTDVVRIRCKDKIFFESKMNGGNAELTITPGESDDDVIYFKKGGGPSTLYVTCGGAITMIAKQALHLEGQMVQIKAAGGNVNIDGAPNVMINCVPIPAMPLIKQPFEEAKMSTSSKDRALPGAILGTAASSSAASSSSSPQDPEKKKTWIDITLKDDHGNPVPGESYRIKLADGSIKEGTLDRDGRARVDGIDPGSAQISFPGRDGGEWKPA